MKEQEVNLERMQQLLSSFNDTDVGHDYKKKIFINTDNNKNSIKEFKDLKLKNPTNEINIDLDDINLILNNQGKISGYSNIVEIKYLIDDILQNIPVDEFKNAKGIMCTYVSNENISMLDISDAMEKINELIPNDCEVIFGTSSTDDLSINEIGYKILLTGIGNNLQELSNIQNPDLKFHKQLYDENHLLKNKNSDLEKQVRVLEAQKNRLEVSLLSLK